MAGTSNGKKPHEIMMMPGFTSSICDGKKDRDCLPPYHYHELFCSYQKQWSKYKKEYSLSLVQKKQRLIVYDLLWIHYHHNAAGTGSNDGTTIANKNDNNDVMIPSGDSHNYCFLIGCTNIGEIAVWCVTTTTTTDDSSDGRETCIENDNDNDDRNVYNDNSFSENIQQKPVFR